jgi:hypothetical protein
MHNAILTVGYSHEASSDNNNKVLASGLLDADLQSAFAGFAQNVQSMVKDLKKYASTGGCEFADFRNGKPGDEALHKTYFPPPACQRSRFRLCALRAYALN